MGTALKVGDRAVVSAMKSRGHGEIVDLTESNLGRKVHVRLDSGELVVTYYSCVEREKPNYRPRR